MDARTTQDQAQKVVKEGVQKAAEAPKAPNFLREPTTIRDACTMDPPRPFRADEGLVAAQAYGAGSDFSGTLP